MNKRNRYLFAVVLGVHLFFAFYNFKATKPTPTPKKSIVVRTHALPKPKAKPAPVIPVKQKPRPKKKKTATAVKKKKAAAPSPKKKDSPKVEPPKKKIPLTPPKKIQSLHIDQTLSPKTEEASYLGTIVQSLQEKLQLPEDGNVRVQVTVLQSGRVEKVSVLYAKSDKNKRYLERALLSLQLPPFTGELKSKRKHTFTFNFCHAK